jgi:hypothetical protein
MGRPFFTPHAADLVAKPICRRDQEIGRPWQPINITSRERIDRLPGGRSNKRLLTASHFHSKALRSWHDRGSDPGKRFYESNNDFVAGNHFGGSPCSRPGKSDVIVLKNGDKITCEVKGLASDTLYISVDYILNTLSVDWTKVDHIESKQLFLVKTQDGTVYTGRISTPEVPGGRPVQIEISETPEKKITLQRKRIVRMDETAANSWQRWNSQLGASFSYTKGNESSQYESQFERRLRRTALVRRG